MQRQDPNWLRTVWELPNTLVLVLEKGRARFAGGEVLFDLPAGLPPEELVYLCAADEPKLRGQLKEARRDAGLSGREEDAEQWVHIVVAPAGLRDRAVSSSGDGQPGLQDEVSKTQGDEGTEVRWVTLLEVLNQLDDFHLGLFTQATAITNWHSSSVYCGSCGTPTQMRFSGWMRYCVTCETEHFPRINPAIITAVVDEDDRLLLGSSYRWDAHRFSTFAGFVEAGESLENAVVREIKEEAGVVVGGVEYLGSQPWPFPSQLMLGFIASVEDPSQAKPDDNEIREVRWFTRRELAEQVSAGKIWIPPRASISRALIEYWYGGPIDDAPADPIPAPEKDEDDTAEAYVFKAAEEEAEQDS